MAESCLSKFEVALQLLEQSADDQIGTESFAVTDLFQDHVVGIVNRLFSNVQSIFTGTSVSELTAFENNNRIILRKMMASKDIPFGTTLYPTPTGMVYPYAKTAKDLMDLYKKDDPSATINLLKKLYTAIDERDRIALSEILRDAETGITNESLRMDLGALFVQRSLSHQTGSTLFGSTNGFRDTFNTLKTTDKLYTEARDLGKELSQIIPKLTTLVKQIIKTKAIDRDTATLATKVLKVLGTRLTLVSELLRKVTEVEHNYVKCLNQAKSYLRNIDAPQ